MKIVRNYRHSNVAAVSLAVSVALLLLSQIFAGVHATEFGDNPHEHAGQTCFLSVIGNGEKAIAANAPIFAAAIFSWLFLIEFRGSDALFQRAVVAKRSRAPPVR